MPALEGTSAVVLGGGTGIVPPVDGGGTAS
jgi:hypothetical protein